MAGSSCNRDETQNLCENNVVWYWIVCDAVRKWFLDCRSRQLVDSSSGLLFLRKMYPSKLYNGLMDWAEQPSTQQSNYWTLYKTDADFNTWDYCIAEKHLSICSQQITDHGNKLNSCRSLPHGFLVQHYVSCVWLKINLHEPCHRIPHGCLRDKG